MKRLPRLFLVTDAEIVAAADFVSRAEAAMRAAGPGCALQLRAHRIGGAAFLRLASRLARVARESGSELWVNDRVDVALAVRAAGIQLGTASLPTADSRRVLGHGGWIGRSVHAPEEAVTALDEGADVALLGHVFASTSHPDRPPLGVDALRRAAGGRPIVAIGGITVDRVREIMDAGAWGVAVLSGVWEEADPAAAARRYREALHEAGAWS